MGLNTKENDTDRPIKTPFQKSHRAIFVNFSELMNGNKIFNLLNYLPPLTIYMAAGISGLTGIVGTLFIKDYLNLSAEFLAALGFWAGIPWALKMPLGHLVDLLWRWKSILVFVGSGLIATSLAIMTGLIGHPEFMSQFAKIEVWFVISVLLSPIGYVIQDVVADAMTVEAVPVVDENGERLSEAEIKSRHTTMQTLGRVAIIGGGLAVALVNIVMFRGVAELSEVEKIAVYINIYQLALVIPLISVLGVGLNELLKWRFVSQLRKKGFTDSQIRELTQVQEEKPNPNWSILGGSSAFVLFTVGIGLSSFNFKEEVIFVTSMAIVLFLMFKLIQNLDLEAKRVLIGTAIVIFVFRAMPGPGPGYTWWSIDRLGFDEQFIAVLGLTASVFALLGIFIFRKFMARRSMAYIVGFLTIAGTILTLPNVGMYYGLHHWTAAHTGGLIDARAIALIDTTLESPLGQVAMIPMLAWIANSAPSNLKATFFAVMASFTNLALSLSQLGTKYLNQWFTVSREVLNRQTGVVEIPADYSELGVLLLVVMAIGFLLPFAAIWLVKQTNLKSA